VMHRKWTEWLNWVSDSDKADLLKHRRNVLFSRFALSGLAVVICHLVLDTWLQLWLSAGFDLVISCVIFASYLLNRRGYHTCGKLLLLITSNFLLLVYCSLLPKSNGIYLFYFPLMAVSALSFHPSQKALTYGLASLSMLSVFSLLVTDFDLFGSRNIPSQQEELSFFVNMMSSMFMLILCVDFMSRTNSASEASLNRLAKEIQHKNEYLEKTNVELDRFLYSTSHDLRAPISSIRGLIMIAQREAEEVSIKKYLNMMHDRTLKLDSFIHDIMNYSRNARTELTVEPVEVKSVVDEITESLKFFEGSERICITNFLVEPKWVGIDKARLRIVLNNLISNAVKYHDGEKENQWIDIKTKITQNQMIISVSDNGIGIDEAYQEKIFEMFFRATDKSKGSGLGLYIVAEVVKRMGGKLRVHSVPEIGSEFIVYLPVEPANEPKSVIADTGVESFV
jgi:signal transduction histidine kinase